MTGEELETELLEQQKRQTLALEGILAEMKRANASRRATRREVQGLVSAVKGLTKSVNIQARRTRLQQRMAVAGAMDREARASEPASVESKAAQSVPIPLRNLRKRQTKD